MGGSAASRVTSGLLLVAAVAAVVAVAAAAPAGQITGSAAPRPPRRLLQAVPPCRGPLLGNACDVTPSPAGGLVLAGGGGDVEEAFRWLIARAGGGDVTVLRAVGTDAYNPFIFALGGVDSVETLVVGSRAAAEDPCIARLALRSEGIFLAGGDQGDYVRLWSGTPLVGAVAAAARRGAVVGGTSAGLAVMGEFAFAALAGSAVSGEVLRNPYHPTVTVVRSPLAVPGLRGVITDSHFYERDRLGRLLVFMARILTDAMAVEARAIGVDETTALLVDESGVARRVGRGNAYFLRASALPERCVLGMPLTFRGVEVVRLGGDATFDLGTWQGYGTATYAVSAVDGVLSSTQVGAGVY